MILKDWNKLVFGDVHIIVKNAMSNVDQIQEQINILGCSDDLFAQEQQA